MSEEVLDGGRPVAVARCVLLDNHHRILLGFRSNTGRWECPGGKVEYETAESAAKREAWEECRIKPRGLPELVGYADVKHMTRERRSLELYLAFPEWEGAPVVVPGEKHDVWAWFGLHETRHLLLMPSCEELLRYLLPGFLARHSDWPPPQIPHVGPVS
jgi:8-oxo-dGTP pyrophosphatase MutT (NUDIX family)